MVNYRVLLVDSDIRYAEGLMDSMHVLNSEINFDCMDSASHAQVMLKTNKYDVLVCNSGMFDESLLGAGSVKGVIVLLDNGDDEFSYSSGINYCLKKPIESGVLLNRIISVILGKKVLKTIDERISKVLLTCGISPHIRGFRYLKDSIRFVCNTPYGTDLKITKDIYPHIAEVNNTAPSRIERGIRHAIESAWERGKLSSIRSLVGFELYDSNYKPTNWEFIRLVSDQLIMEIEREEALL